MKRRYKVKLRNIPVPTEPYDDNVILADTFRQDELSDKRVSQVWFYYGKINPLGGSDDASNYRVSLATVSLDSEERYGTPANQEDIFTMDHTVWKEHRQRG